MCSSAKIVPKGETVQLIEASWPNPRKVVAFTTTRSGGDSVGEYQGLNLGDHVGDVPGTVGINRQKLGEILSEDATVTWLDQVHGTRVVEAGWATEADASWSSAPGQVCAVLTADCLPVLLCDQAGSCVGAAHAGWRGLVSGILENTVASMPAAPNELQAWLGPAIGPLAFEVGPEVRSAFFEASTAAQRVDLEEYFVPSKGGGDRYLADLYGIAKIRLKTLGVHRIYGGEYCTFSDPARFYSYRRDGQTGRMASLIYLKSR